MKEQSIRKKTADLAMIKDGNDRFYQDADSLVSLADKLSSAIVTGSDKNHAAKSYTSLREDTPKKCMDKQDVLAISPAVKDGYIFVPSVMEKE